MIFVAVVGSFAVESIPGPGGFSATLADDHPEIVRLWEEWGVEFGVVAAVVALWVLVKLLRWWLRRPEEFPYEPQEALFTPAEAAFLRVLDEAVGDDYRVFGKARVADVIRVRQGLDQATWQAAFNRIKSKHVDFVICCPADLSVRFLVELDDSTHQRADRIERDRFLDAAMDAAGVSLLRIPVSRSYSVREIAGLIREAALCVEVPAEFEREAPQLP